MISLKDSYAVLANLDIYISQMNMTELLKTWLKRWPGAYTFLRRIYYALRFRRLKEVLFGTEVIEREWATRHLQKNNCGDWNTTGSNWIKGYWDSQSHPHRQLLMEKLQALFPVRNILEIGCNSGPNLALLAKKYPDTKMAGIDINPMAVEKGKEWLAKEGILNVALSVGKADELHIYPDSHFDVVFTDAVLIFIGPDKIKNVIREMLRIARKALVLIEWNFFGSCDTVKCGLGVYHYGFWKRDYAVLLRQFVRDEQIHITKIPEKLWPIEGWRELGAVIEVTI